MPIVLQWPSDGADAAARARNSFSSISPAASLRRERQITVPEPTSSPSCQPSSIGPPDSTMAGMSTVEAAMIRGRRGLVAAGGEHHRIDRIAVQDLHQARDRRDCGRAPRSAGGNSRRSDAREIPSARRRRRGCPRARASASSRCTRLQGVRSLPVCAMPMMGLPLRSSSAVSP